MKTVVLDPKTWACGGSAAYRAQSGTNHLLNEDGSMCCLGFASLKFGATKAQIDEAPMPCDTDPPLDVVFADLGLGSNDLNTLAEINDDEEGPIRKVARVAKLNAVLKELGADFRFKLKTPVSKVAPKVMPKPKPKTKSKTKSKTVPKTKKR